MTCDTTLDVVTCDTSLQLACRNRRRREANVCCVTMSPLTVVYACYGFRVVYACYGFRVVYACYGFRVVLLDLGLWIMV